MTKQMGWDAFQSGVSSQTVLTSYNCCVSVPAHVDQLLDQHCLDALFRVYSRVRVPSQICTFHTAITRLIKVLESRVNSDGV